MFTNTYKKALFIGAIVMIVLLSGCTSTPKPINPWNFTPSQIKKNINNWDEDSQIIILTSGRYGIGTRAYVGRNTGEFIKYIKNPSKKVQIAAVSGSPNNSFYYSYKNIQYIKNPDIEIIQAAMKGIDRKWLGTSGRAEQYIKLYQMIKNPSDEVTLELLKEVYRLSKSESKRFFCRKGQERVLSEKLLLTITKDYPLALNCLKFNNINTFNKKSQMQLIQNQPSLLAWIKNPDKEIQLAAIKKDSTAIRFIKNPDKEVQLAAIKKDSTTIRFIKKPDEDIKRIAFQKNLANIRYIKNPDEDMQLAAVTHYGKFIRYIKNPTKKVQLKAVQNISYCKKGMDHPLKYISNPSEETILTAIIFCSYAIDYVSNPSKKAKILAFGRVDIEKPNFKVSDKNIELTVTNGQIKIKNKTNKFVKIISLAEYHGEDVYTLTAHSLPPKSVQKVYSPKSGTVITTKNLLKDKYIQFGYAIEYKVGNGSTKNLYLVKKYPVNKFL